MINNYTQKEFEERFTKTNDAIKHISELESLDLKDISDDELESKINNCFNIIPYTSATIPVGSELFRARVNINKTPFDKVKDIYVPPPNKITEYGRANRPS